MKELCDIKSIAKYLGVSVQFVRMKVYARRIPYYRVGNRLKFDKKEIDIWVEQYKEDVRGSILISEE